MKKILLATAMLGGLAAFAAFHSGSVPSPIGATLPGNAPASAVADSARASEGSSPTNAETAAFPSRSPEGAASLLAYDAPDPRALGEKEIEVHLRAIDRKVSNPALLELVNKSRLSAADSEAFGKLLDLRNELFSRKLDLMGI